MSEINLKQVQRFLVSLGMTNQQMVYPNLKFPKRTGRPFFYTNFVSTVDGKVQVLRDSEDYWPIGSKVDHQVLMELRAYADALVHGKNLGLGFGEITLKSLNRPSFKKLRKKLEKKTDLPYYIMASHPKELSHLRSGSMVVSDDPKTIAQRLYKAGYENILVEGGPTLLGSFLKENLLDEIFLTIAPKIFGNENTSTLTLVEGYLFPKKSIKKLNLLSVKRFGNELFLRYEVENN